MEAEKFRRITMKVLTMQLNSITVMDLDGLRRGGAGGGAGGDLQYPRGAHVSFWPAALAVIILLAADFFLPMRQLGSVFPHRDERHGCQR